MLKGKYVPVCDASSCLEQMLKWKHIAHDDVTMELY